MKVCLCDELNVTTQRRMREWKCSSTDS